MSYRVEFGGGAQVQFHSLPEHARDALIGRAAELAMQPWDAVVRPPGDDARFREAVFGSGVASWVSNLTMLAPCISALSLLWSVSTTRRSGSSWM